MLTTEIQEDTHIGPVTLTALLVIDPDNDFISDGGKLWNRVKAVAEANTARRSRNQMLVVVLRVNLPATALNYFTAKRLEINSPGLQYVFSVIGRLIVKFLQVFIFCWLPANGVR